MKLEFNELKYLYNMLLMYGNKQKRNIRKNKLPDVIIKEYQRRIDTNDVLLGKISVALKEYV